MNIKNEFGWIIGVVVLLGAVPALALVNSMVSPSGSYIYADQQGTLTWNPISVGTYDVQSQPSLYTLNLDSSQRKNLNNRQGELIVRFAEEYFKNQVLKEVLTQSMATGSSLLTSLFNSEDLIVWDSSGASQLYNTRHVQIVQIATNCAQGSICFIGRMYDSSGQIIQARNVVVFPTTTPNIIAQSGMGN